MKGFLSVRPAVECGATMYASEYSGNMAPMRTISAAWSSMFFRRKPGTLSYQMDASSC